MTTDKYYAAHKEAVKIRSKKYYEDHREHALKVRKTWRDNNKEKMSEWYKQYRGKNRDAVRDRQKKWNNKNIIRRKLTNLNGHYKRTYGLSYEEVINLISLQNGLCKICGDKLDANKQTCVDHNHKTGKVRGILCRKCNVGIGAFQENKSIMLKASHYIESDGSFAE